MKLSDFMDMAGETFRVERGEEMFTAEGIRHRQEKRMDFEPKTDVRQGDWLTSPDSGKRFYVRETDVQMVERQPFALQVFYQTEVEYEEEKNKTPQQPTVYNIFGDTFGSNIGNQHHAEVLQPSFTFNDLDQAIDRWGGDDTEALKEMVEEVRSTLENQDSLSRTRFFQWSELINRHSWITGPVAQLLLLYATTGQIT